MNSFEMYKSVFNYASVAIGIFSTDGRILDMNENLRGILGYDENDLSQLSVKSLIHFDDSDEVLLNYSKVIKGEIPFAHGIKRFINKNNEIIWGELRSVPIYNKKKEITAIVSTIFEIAEQNNVNRLLRKQNEKYNWLCHYYNDNAVIVINEDMNVIRANKKFRGMVGVPVDKEVADITFLEFIHEDEQKRLINYHYRRRKADEKVPNQYYCRIKYSDNSFFTHLLKVSMIPGTKNSIVSISEKLAADSGSDIEAKTDNVFRLLAENATDQIFISDLDFNINYISPSVERILGYTQEEFKMLAPEEYMTTLSYENIEKFQGRMLNQSDDFMQVIRMELQVVHKDGSMIWLETLMKFILDENGYPTGVIGSSRDVSERKNSEEALKASEERYRVLTESIKDVVLVVSPDLIIEYISPSVEAFCNYLPEEIAGTHISNYFADKNECKNLVHHFCNSFKINESATASDFVLNNRDNEPFYIEITANPVIKDGKMIMAHCVARDVSERKKVEKKLREEGETLSIENITLKKSIIKSKRFGDIIGKSEQMLKVYELILKAVPSSANIIIYGESGTGKELVAKAVHEMSDRSEKPFVVVNCGAIPETIIESEFFGYKKGAFTGAVEDKEGFLDLADGGTLFLDEVGEIGLSMQVKLLRAIEGGGFSPVGSNQVKKPRLHIVAATNRNLSEMVLENKMREDFFFRIHVIPINMPPLRERKEDIPLLMEHFLAEFRINNVAENIPLEVKKAFMNYHWPGNVRELQNALHRYLTINQIGFLDSPMGQIKPVEIFEDKDHHQTGRKTLSVMVGQYEKRLISKELSNNKWNKSKTADILKIDRKTLSSKIKKYGLTAEQ